MIKKTLLIIFLFVYCFSINGQSDSLQIYEVNRLRSGLISLAGLSLQQLGLAKQRRAPKVAEGTILNLNPDEVPGFDRVSLRQDYQKRRDAAKLSDHALNYSLILPFTLLLDRKIRRNWADYTLLYLESQALSNNFYTWSPFGPTFVDRMRPVAYYSEVSLEERTDNKTRQSFFSGHVSSVATASFFMAKVYNDYHPELEGKKWITYGLAAIPPTFVGIYRIKALRHFPSDIIVGGIIGAASGIIVPHWHRKSKGMAKVSILYREGAKGMNLSLTF